MLGTVTRAGDEAWASVQPHAGVKGWGEMPLLSPIVLLSSLGHPGREP